MTTKKLPEFKCDQCDYIAHYAKVLGSHKRRAHGIMGTAESTLRNRQMKERRGAAPPTGPFQCTHCGYISQSKAGLSNHLRSAHGDTSNHKPGYVRSTDFKTRLKSKGTKLAKLTPQTIVVARSQEAPATNHSEGHSDGIQTIPDSVVAITTGRFQELCRSIAYQYELPEKLFAARVAALVYATTVR